MFKQPFDISSPLAMNERCEYCNLKYEAEPGYWFGAMFVSYIWTGWLALVIIGFCIIYLDWSVGASFALLILVAAISYFFILRISRSIYIHLDVKYDETATQSS